MYFATQARRKRKNVILDVLDQIFLWILSILEPPVPFPNPPLYSPKPLFLPKTLLPPPGNPFPKTLSPSLKFGLTAGKTLAPLYHKTLEPTNFSKNPCASSRVERVTLVTIIPCTQIAPVARLHRPPNLRSLKQRWDHTKRGGHTTPISLIE